MIISITSIKLKGPFAFFHLSLRAMYIVKQLRNTPCKEFRKRGIWTTHYTMTLWENEQDMAEFARSQAHLEAMKVSGRIAREIRLHTYEGPTLPSWPEAIKMLEKARVLNYA